VPVITVNLVFTTIGGLEVFELPLVLTGGGPYRCPAAKPVTAELGARTGQSPDVAKPDRPGAPEQLRVEASGQSGCGPCS
jgi:hypothetical protein